MTAAITPPANRAGRAAPVSEAGGYYFIENLLYQPSQWEKVDAVKGWRPAAERDERRSADNTAHASGSAVTYVSIAAGFYNSQDRFFGTVAPDALAVIGKTESA
ncbi:MAG TPA: hypothetical protein VFT21_06895 [Gemmatimonadaceae bacterium]|nr:hypothetical protein [Gemmatimonadaceae bacterium]